MSYLIQTGNFGEHDILVVIWEWSCTNNLVVMKDTQTLAESATTNALYNILHIHFANSLSQRDPTL